MTTNIRDVSGATNDLFVATDTGLYRHDGERWTPATTARNFELLDIDGRGDSIFILNPVEVEQLFRIRSW